MPIEKLSFNAQINRSLQIGDTVYYTRFPSTSAYNSGMLSYQNINDNSGVLTGASGVSSDPIKIGLVTNIGDGEIFVEVATAGSLLPNDFILFSKPGKANESGIKGYYADVTLENYSSKRVELFAVSSEITASSK